MKALTVQFSQITYLNPTAQYLRTRRCQYALICIPEVPSFKVSSYTEYCDWVEPGCERVGYKQRIAAGGTENANSYRQLEKQYGIE
jgi:hypothetical protein